MENHCNRGCIGNSGSCKHAGIKRFNYGFVKGAASYCWLVKKWLSDFNGCPKDKESK